MKGKASISALMRAIDRQNDAARQNEWRRRGMSAAERRADNDRPADRWIIKTLAASGALPGELIAAATEYARALENMHRQTSCALGERVSGGRGDPHVAILLAMEANQAAASARAYLGEHCRADHCKAFDLCFAYPHLSAAQVLRAIGKSGGSGMESIARALRATLTRLCIIWAMPLPVGSRAPAAAPLRLYADVGQGRTPAGRKPLSVDPGALDAVVERIASGVARNFRESVREIETIRRRSPA